MQDIEPTPTLNQDDSETSPIGSLPWFALCAERLKVIADPHRLQIIAVLLEGPKHVGDIAQEIGEAIVRVSHHLSVMRYARLVVAKKQGRFVQYTLHPDVFAGLLAEATEQVLDLGCCRFALPHPAGRRQAGEQAR